MTVEDMPASGGSYVRDPATGALARVADSEPVEVVANQAPAPTPDPPTIAPAPVPDPQPSLAPATDAPIDVSVTTDTKSRRI